MPWVCVISRLQFQESTSNVFMPLFALISGSKGQTDPTTSTYLEQGDQIGRISSYLDLWAIA
jgi:hypothetical protein